MMSEDKDMLNVPVIPLRDVVVYPNMVVPLFVGREQSIECLEFAMSKEKKITLIAQKDPDMDTPDIFDLYSIGTAAVILQLLKLPDGTVKVLVEGSSRVKIESKADNDKILLAYLDINAI